MEEAIKDDFIERITDNGVSMLFFKERGKMDKVSMDILSRIKHKGFRLIYVTASLPAKSIREKLEQADLSDYYIIDSVTSNLLQDDAEADKCVFIRSPGDLTEISITLEGMLKKGGELFIVVDSITSFLIYNSENEMLRFIHFTSSIAREKKNRLVFLIIENSGISAEFLDKIRSFIDEEANIE